MPDKKTILYVDAGNWTEFLQFQKTTTQYECIYIADETFLRGKSPGLIKRIGSFERRWNYVAISEMIERAYDDWIDFFKDQEFKEEMKRTGLTEEDLDYGIGS